MAWYVVLAQSINQTTTGGVKASVQQFPNALAYKQIVGEDPTQVLPAGWQSANGFATQTQANAVAARYNALPKDNRSAGGKALAPSVMPGKVPSIPGLSAITNVNDFLSRLTSGNTWLRVGEFILGALLLLAGAMHISGHDADLKDIGKLAFTFAK